jgi:hypothetical protein
VHFRSLPFLRSPYGLLRLSFLSSLHSTSTQSTSDTFHTMLFLMVGLTFLLAGAARCGAPCESSPRPEWEQSGQCTLTFISFHAALHLLLQSPSDTVHTMLFLMVALTFLLAGAARCNAPCKSSPSPERDQSGRCVAFLPTWERRKFLLTSENLPEIFSRIISVPERVTELSLAK